jgi:hypothetical protein
MQNDPKGIDDDVITLQSNDGKYFKECLEDLEKSKIISLLIKDIGFKDLIQLHGINGNDLELFLKYYKKLEDIKNLISDKEILFSLLSSSNYLDYEEMQQACCESIAKNLKQSLSKDSENGILNWFGETEYPTENEINEILEDCPWMKLDK